MNRHALAAILALCAMAFIASALWLIPSSSAAKPVEGLNLVPVFKINADAEAARDDVSDLAGIAWANARWLERDGKRPKTERLIVSGINVAEYRKGVKDEMLAAGFRGKYPDLATTLGSFLDDRAGKDSRELTDDQRAAWVAAFDDIAKAAKHAEASL